MATEVTLFRDHKGLVPPGPGGIDEVTRRLIGGASLKRISIKGGKFRMMVNGQEVARAPGTTLEVVVVNAAPAVARQYYAKLYDPNATAIPDCWSNDGVRPDGKCPAPQAKFCAACPQNIAGSGTGKSRACRYNQKLAVLLANDIEHSDIYQVQLPATSIFGKDENGLMPLQAYAKQLSAYKYPITSVVTEMAFDEGVESPKLFFKAIRPLEEFEREIVKEKGETPEALAAISFNPAQIDKAKEELAGPPPAVEQVFRDEPTVRSAKPRPEVPVTNDINDTLSQWADETDD